MKLGRGSRDGATAGGCPAEGTSVVGCGADAQGEDPCGGVRGAVGAAAGDGDDPQDGGSAATPQPGGCAASGGGVNVGWGGGVYDAGGENGLAGGGAEDSSAADGCCGNAGSVADGQPVGAGEAGAGAWATAGVGAHPAPRSGKVDGAAGADVLPIPGTAGVGDGMSSDSGANGTDCWCDSRSQSNASGVGGTAGDGGSPAIFSSLT